MIKKSGPIPTVLYKKAETGKQPLVVEVGAEWCPGCIVLKKKLDKIGFKVDIKREVSDKKSGTVLEQSLEKGYKQDPTDKDRTITLTISGLYS